jgi:hypothetical protein
MVETPFVGCDHSFFTLFAVSIRSWAGYAPPAAWHRLEASNLLLPCNITCLSRFTPAKLRHAYPCTVHTAAGGLRKLGKALAGGFQADGGIGGVRPGFRLGEIPFLPPAHITFSGTLHLVDFVPGVPFAVILDVPGVQLFQLVARPCGRVAQLRKHGEEGVAAVPAAQPGAPKSGCMILPEICTDNSGKIQKRR